MSLPDSREDAFLENGSSDDGSGKNALHEGRHPTSSVPPALVEAISEYAIFLLDSDGCVTSWNRGAQAIKGYSPSEILDQHFSVFYTPDDAEAGVPEDVLEHAARTGQWTGEGWRVRKSGERFWAHVTITALYDEGDDTENGRGDDKKGESSALRGFVKVTRDMTEQRKRKEALTREKRHAERKSALLELMQVVAATAHNAARLGEALQQTVDAVCARTGWPVGHVYRVERGTASDCERNEGICFVPTSIWCLACPETFKTFRRVTETTTFPLGNSLPGRAAACGEPVWIRNVADDPDFERARLAEELGVKGAFAVPVQHMGDTVAVIEFFSANEEEPDEMLMEAMGSVGVQLSRVVERVHAREALEEQTEALRQSEHRYRRLFETSQEAIVITSPGGTILDANMAACALNGYAREELIGMNTSAFYSKEAREEFVDALQKSGQVLAREVRMRRKNGEEIICQVSATVWRDANGEIEAIQSFTRDITKECRARQALEESEEKFRMLAEKALVGIAVVQDETVRYANPAYAQIFGYTPGEIIGCSPRTYIGADDWSRRIQPQLTQLLAGEIGTFRHTSRAFTKTGETIFIEGGGGRIVYEGRPALLGMVRDITERRHLQREVLNMQEEERRRLGRDLHDGMGSKLTGIGLILSALPRREGVGSEATREIKEIRELIQECVRDVRRLSHGLAPSGLSGDSLVDALERLVKHIKGARLEVGERFSTGLEKPHPLSDEAAAQVYWIAQEAVTNAQKYAEASAIAIRLTVEDSALIVEVEDNGQGFDPRRLEESLNENSLGLRTMRYRTELLGGTLEIDTAPGEGTRVTCRLPA